jgi:hypothetical protein
MNTSITSTKNKNRKIDENIEALISWSKSKGIYGIGPGEKLTICNTNSGIRGLLCSTDIFKGEILISLPIEICFVAEDPRFPPPYKEADWKVTLACRILKEISRGEDSVWQPYIDGLINMKNEDRNFILTDVLHEFEYLPLVTSIQKLRDSIQKAYSMCPISSHGGATISNFSWALNLVNSRSYSFISNKNTVVNFIAPITEMINHGENLVDILFNGSQAGNYYHMIQKISWFSLTLKSKIVFRADTSLKQGREILICYGKKTNDDFLLDHGFILKSNKVNYNYIKIN